MPKTIIIPGFLNVKKEELSASKRLSGKTIKYKLYLNSELIFDYDTTAGEDETKWFDQGLQCSLVIDIINELLKPQEEEPIERPEPVKPAQDPNVLHLTVKPEAGDWYGWIAGTGEIHGTEWANDTGECQRWEAHNCYTKENADIALSINQAKIELQNIASELNAGRVIDWGGDNKQLKYTLYFSHLRNQIDWSGYYYNQYADIVCLERCFPEVALEQMGLEKLNLALGKWKN